MAKDFAFDQRLRNGGAVDGDKRLGFAIAQRVHGARKQFFAGTALAGDEHAGGAGRNHFDQAKHFLHALGGTDQGAQYADIAQLAAAGFQLTFGAAQARGILQDVAQPGGIHRLLDEIEGAAFHGADRGVDAALGSEQDHGNRLRLGSDALQQLHAVHTRHAQIGDDDCRTPELDRFQAFDAVAGGLGFVAPSPHQFGQASSFVLFVLDNQNFFLRHGS